MTELLSMSAQGAVLILAAAALRALFGRRVPPTLLYALWLLPAARLLIPGSVASAFSLANLVPAEAGRRVEAALQTVTAAAAPAGGAAASVSPAVSPRRRLPRPLTWGSSFSCSGWPGRAAVVLLALWHNLAFARRAKRGAVPVEVPCPLPVYLSGGLTSPCLCGLFRPAVYLCDGALTSQAGLDMALATSWPTGGRGIGSGPCCGWPAAPSTGSIPWCGWGPGCPSRTVNGPATTGSSGGRGRRSGRPTACCSCPT